MVPMTWLNDETGSEAWWQEQQQRGIPLIETASDSSCQVTFFWRDPQGSETTSTTRRVWINITSVTDHHQATPPQSLLRIPDSDVWYWQTQLPSDWRGSYCLMPDEQGESFSGQPEMYALRNWWRTKFPHAQADPLNPLRSWSGGRGMSVSPLHMPQAPDQQIWRAVDKGHAPTLPLRHYEWRSERLGNSRSVWIYSSGTGTARPATRPLAILLDGQFWAHNMPIAWPVQQLTDAGSLPPAVYLMIDTIDNEHRSRELPCHSDFWLAVQHELLPLVQQWAPFCPEAASTVVAGQSYGGLAAVYAVLNWPRQFGCAISQSGSFWWPSRASARGWLIEQLENGMETPAPLRFWLEAGRREHLILLANQILQQQLTDAGHLVSYHPVEGGHDALCWRGGLLNGLKAMWQPI